MVEVIQEAAGEIDGQPVSRFTLRNTQGVEVVILPWGAVIQSVRIPDRKGDVANVVLGFADLATYVTGNLPFFGCVAGRYANRLSGTGFELDGVRYTPSLNVGTLTLHGGNRGFDKHLWDAEACGKWCAFDPGQSRRRRGVSRRRSRPPSPTPWMMTTACNLTTRRKRTSRPSSTSPIMATGTWPGREAAARRITC